MFGKDWKAKFSRSVFVVLNKIG